MRSILRSTSPTPARPTGPTSCPARAISAAAQPAHRGPFLQYRCLHAPAPYTFGNAGRDISPAPATTSSTWRLQRRSLCASGQSVRIPRREPSTRSTIRTGAFPAQSRFRTVLRQDLHLGGTAPHAVRAAVPVLSLCRGGNATLGGRGAWALLHLREPRTEPLLQLSESDWKRGLGFLRPLPSHPAPRAAGRASKCRSGSASAPTGTPARTVSAFAACRKCTGPWSAVRGTRRLHRAQRSHADRALGWPCGRSCSLRSRFIRAARKHPDCSRSSPRMRLRIFPAMEDFPTDHLPALIRKTGWEWRGDFFDPEIPTAIELHHRFWNSQFARLRRRRDGRVLGAPVGARD